METLKKRFGFEKQIKTPHPLLGEDFVFKKEEYESLKEFKEVLQEVSFLENPKALERKIYFTHTEKKQKTLQLTIILCWNGYQDALELLYKFPESFVRQVPIENISEIAKDKKIGSVGFGWSWQGKEKPDMVAFVRNNVFIAIQGRDTGDVILSLGTEIDSQLEKRNIKQEYFEVKKGLFSLEKRFEVLKVTAGGRIDIGTFPKERKNLYFLTESGSVNRDIDNPDLWYYRAGMKKGIQEITLFWVEKGILPKKERLMVEIV